MVPAAGLEPATSRLRSACTAIVRGRRIIILAETRAVGRSYGSRGALMLRERRPARLNSLRAEDPLEVLVHPHDEVARDVRIGDGSVCEDKRAAPRALLRLRRGAVATAFDQFAFDQFVWGLAIADHLVLLPVWRRTWVSAGYARAKLRP